MNERIKELAEQAREFATTRHPVSNIVLSVNSEQFEEKFALLIMQEYIDKIETYRIPVGNSAAGEMACEMTYSALMEIRDEIKEHFGVESTSIKVGSRVKVVSGFNVGAKGTVSYIEPTGRMWVMRDGASTDVFYTPDEVVRIEQ